MPTIFDNTAHHLGAGLRATFGAHSKIDIATGYMDLRGWDSLADIVDAKFEASRTLQGEMISGMRDTAKEPIARILVGMVAPADSQQILDSLQKELEAPNEYADLADFETARARKARLVSHLREQLMRGLSSVEGQRTLQALKRQLREGSVQIKVFTARPLHGKTYILHNDVGHYAPTMAYVGSSNLTKAGLYSNLELNIDVMDQDASAKLAHWFETHWNDPFSLPVTEEIVALIEESWADEQQATPYEVFLKICFLMSQDVRDGFGYVLPTSLKNLLLDYQDSAVRILARRIVRRGGTMLGDVVGLGKTLTAIATASMLQNAEDYTTLVLCPKNLEQMWAEHLEAYDIQGRVIAYSMAAKLLPDLKRHHLVICDESHNLRTGNTRQDYQAIKEYVRSNDSKVLLLTATPYNLAFEDVANQIGLYIDDDDDLGIQPNAALTLDPGIADKVNGKTSTLGAFRLSEEAEDWKRLMSDHLVRRTRSFIKRTAKTTERTLRDGRVVQSEYLEFADGTPFFFPQRIARPLSHAFDQDDAARLMEDDETLDAIKSLRLPRYVLANYDAPTHRHTQEDLDILDDIRSGRGNVAGFVRTGLFKRLSSSGHSFIQSLQRQRARNDLFLYAIENRLPIPLGTIAEHNLGTLNDDDVEAPSEYGSASARYDHLRQHLPKSTKWINSTIFSGALAKDLDEDNRTLKWLLDRFGAWDPTKDSKINALVDLLQEQHPGEKVLVFTEYKDTAEYVAETLRDAGVGNVGVATGDSGDPGSIARRFSPGSNKLPGHSAAVGDVADPIDVLIATDVLSEGQNLQDAHIVVNYDLPWAIIKLIQRAGRVDRVGQQSESVFVYLISHEKVEEQLSLRQRIKHRLESSAQAFGSDEQFFGTDKEVRMLDNFYHGSLSDEAADEDAADAVSEAWLVWSAAAEKHPEIAQRVMNMPDLIHSTRAQYTKEATGGVACYVSTDSGIDAFAFSSGGQDGLRIRERLLTPVEAFQVFRAELETPTAELRPDHFERVKDLVRGPLTSETVAAGNLKGVRKRVWERYTNSLDFAKAQEALEALHARPLQQSAEQRLRSALRNRMSDDDVLALLNQLHGDERLVVPSSDTDPVRIICSLGVLD
ncbi:helicase-related protein [Paenarthrobacter sp. NPDC058040]|uniref:helicase-related protein n=1 Tax=unclassified Paenarthrobacter TaxID=2634190 RepID=UPI0036D79EFF